MKAIVIHSYGDPDVLKFEDYPDPVAGPGEVLVRVAAAGINPIDIMRRSGRAKDFMPIQFPGIIGVDLAGTVAALGPGVEGFAVGDRVIAMADRTYAQLCVVKAATLVRLPEGLDPIDAAALPLVTTTGTQLIADGTGIRSGQTVLITGAVGGVGRSAVFAAKERGATVIAGVLKKQLQVAQGLGADQVIATDDAGAVAALPPVDAVADTVDGKTAEQLITKVKRGGVFASVLGPPANAKEHASVRVVPVFAVPSAATLLETVRAARDGKLVIPIARRLALKDAAEGHAAVQNGAGGKVLLLA